MSGITVGLRQTSLILTLLLFALKLPNTNVSKNPDPALKKYLIILALQGPVYGDSRQKSGHRAAEMGGSWSNRKVIHCLVYQVNN